jgi:hypothetical protein
MKVPLHHKIDGKFKKILKHVLEFATKDPDSEEDQST